MEAQIQEDWQLLVRDIYAFYPLLIKYVDLQRNHWLRNNISEAEDLYKHVAEIFNMWSKSQVNINFPFLPPPFVSLLFLPLILLNEKFFSLGHLFRYI